ncbi:MAG: hypothetical protein ACR2LL_02395 [Nitrosopumilus sp.]|uniref:hypothetical protein n=1 Tax=Nitrosopumilus sp. TaxID=2024843 RepID=UPI00292E7FF2|nr:hypothetical protein [Nitrosopumilus sp.]
MSTQVLESKHFVELKLSLRDEIVLEYYRIMSNLAQYKRNVLKNKTNSFLAKILRWRTFS